MNIERGVFKEKGINKNIEVIGKGPIGEKAGQFLEKAGVLNCLGFSLPRTKVLAQSFIEGYLKENGLEKKQNTDYDPQVEKAILEGSFSEKSLLSLKQISGSLGDTPLVIRSSAIGDARGAGTYVSVFTDNNSESVKNALRQVMAGYYSEDAYAFRKDTKVNEGFGIMIQPVVGQEMERDFFSPVLSGFGYTSTSREEGYINAVPGLGGGVEERHGEKITREMLAPFKGIVGKYLKRERERMGEGLKAKRISSLLRTLSGYEDDFMGNVFLSPDFRDKSIIEEREIDIFSSLLDLNFNPLFDKISGMEKFFGKPQYFEWAMTMDKDKPKYWILQIAEINKKLDAFEFENYGKPIIEGHSVTGSGIIESDKVVECLRPEDLDSLRKFNEENTGYVLFYPSSLSVASSCGTLKRNARTITYKDINNAAVLFEINNINHRGNPLEHFRGQLDMTGKFFGATEINHFEKETQRNWDDFLGEKKDETGLITIEKKVKVVASEKQNRIILYTR